MIAVYIGAEPRFGRRTRALSHLEGCRACAQRYEAFVEQMAGLREDAVAEADEAFTPARLEAQRQAILYRLENASHPARVIQFPAHGTSNLSIFTGNQVRRWIAAAAAAGLIIGITLGRISDFTATPRNTNLQPVPPKITQPTDKARPALEVPNEEEIFWRVEQAQGEMLVPTELEALGGMTPIREVSMSLPARR